MLIVELFDDALVRNVGGRLPTVLTMRESKPLNKKLMLPVFHSLLEQLLNLIDITVVRF